MIDQLTAAQLLGMQKRGTKREEITATFLQSIRQNDERLGAFLNVDDESALTQARAVDAKRSRGEPLGALAGLPVAIKDVLCMAGEPTTCGSKILEHFRPPYDAHVITRLRQADAVLLGKTNMDEFAMGSSTENSAYKPTRNPWNLECTPGGSSGGSAAAVAGCLAPFALGTDTGGSVRQPASLCGLVGLKPTYGRVSRYGLIAFASSLDQVGTLTHDVVDAAMLFEAVAGHDARDSTSAPMPVPAYHAILNQPLSSLTIGVPREFFAEGLDAEVEQAVKDALRFYQDSGAVVKEISLPHSAYAVATYYLIATAEASSNLARYDGVHFGLRADKFDGLADMTARSRGQGFGAEVKRRIMLGAYALSSGYYDAYYLKALKVRRLIKNDFDAAFAGCDVIAGPTTPTAAFKLGEKTGDPLAMYLSDIYTISANLAGIPAVSVPCGFNKAGLPIGLQLIGPAFAEEKLLRVAHAYLKEMDWHKWRPRW